MQTLIDKHGTIDFPVLGQIKAEGLTIAELRDTLKASLKSIFTGAYCKHSFT